MTAKQNNEIKAFLSPKNNRYHVVINWYDDNNKRQRQWVATGISVKGNNKRKAETRKNEILDEWKIKILNKGDNYLFADYLKTWVIDSKNRLSPTTYDVYEHMMEKHIYPYFHKLNLNLNEVTPTIIQQYYTTKQNEGLSSNTVIKHHAVMRTALQDAIPKIILENPCDLINKKNKPKRTKYHGVFYNEQELRTLLNVAKGTPLEVVIFIAAYFGLRRSEVIGLKWDAIDFTNRTLRVQHKVIRQKVDGKMSEFATDELKTESSYRVLPLDDNLIEFFMNHKHQQNENRTRNGDSHINEYNDYVCVNELGDRLKPDYVTDNFNTLLKRNNLKKIRFHDLRHSCASLLLAIGYTMKEIQEWLGHSDYLTTANIYGHLEQGNRKYIIEGLSNALSA